MRPAWSEMEDGVTWATAGRPGKRLIRLMVEHLPDGSWEWTTWPALRPGELQCGSRLTRVAACAAAERAACDMTAISHLRPVPTERDVRRGRSG